MAALEAELGARLLQRSTRAVSLTPEGTIYLEHARVALARLAAGREAVGDAAQVAQGRLRVSLSPVLGRPLLEGLPRLIERHPRLEVELGFTDAYVDLGAGVDVVLRIGPPADSALVGRRLRRMSWCTVASPAYLARAGLPARAEELATHRCLHFLRPNGTVADWDLGGPLPSALRVDQGEMLVQAAVAGLGIARAFDLLVAAPIARGELVEILPGERRPGPEVYALCLPGTAKLPRVAAFLDFVGGLLG